MEQTGTTIFPQNFFPLKKNENRGFSKGFLASPLPMSPPLLLPKPRCPASSKHPWDPSTHPGSHRRGTCGGWRGPRCQPSTCSPVPSHRPGVTGDAGHPREGPARPSAKHHPGMSSGAAASRRANATDPRHGSGDRRAEPSASSHSPVRDAQRWHPASQEICVATETSQRASLGQCSCSSCSPASDCASAPTPGAPSLPPTITMPGTGQHKPLLGPGRCSHEVQGMPRHHATSSKCDMSICRASLRSLLSPVLNPTS